MSGPQPDLDAVDPSTIEAHIAVGRLAPGTHEVDVVVEPLDGLDLVSVAPETVRVDVSRPPEPSRRATCLDVARAFRIRRPGRRHDPAVRHGRHPGHRQRGPQADPRLRPGPRDGVASAGRRGPLLVGQDTRRSGDMLVAAVVAGATSLGADVHRLGVCPTPALAFVTDDRRLRGRDHGVARPTTRPTTTA